MKLKTLPWISVLGLIVGLAVLFAFYRKQEAGLAQLRQENQELQTYRTQTEEAKTAAAEAQNAELERLRKESEELLRLRNEVRQLRDDRQRLGKEVQTAQAQAQNAQVQAQNVQAQVQALQANAAQQAAQLAAVQGGTPPPGLTPEQQAAFAKRYGLNPATPATDQDKLNVCVNNLRQIDGAKQQWALENRKTPETVPTAQDLLPYLRTGALPSCPAGGVYTLNPLNASVTCSIPGHALPK